MWSLGPLREWTYFQQVVALGAAVCPYGFLHSRREAETAKAIELRSASYCTTSSTDSAAAPVRYTDDVSNVRSPFSFLCQHINYVLSLNLGGMFLLRLAVNFHSTRYSSTGHALTTDQDDYADDDEHDDDDDDDDGGGGRRRGRQQR